MGFDILGARLGVSNNLNFVSLLSMKSSFFYLKSRLFMSWIELLIISELRDLLWVGEMNDCVVLVLLVVTLDVRVLFIALLLGRYFVEPPVVNYP